MRNERKAIAIIKKNASAAAQILVSEDFMKKLIPLSAEIEIESKVVTFGKGDKGEQFYLFKIPLIYSNILLEGAIIIMKDGENVVIQGV